jgi:hypothetical protein
MSEIPFANCYELFLIIYLLLNNSPCVEFGTALDKIVACEPKIWEIILLSVGEGQRFSLVVASCMTVVNRHLKP